TDPTDNFGNIGVLGSASLNANFLTQKISADVKLGINNQIWQANDNNIVLNTDGSFSTNNMLVTAIDSSGVEGINSAGSAAGQLVQPLESVTNIPQGAALGYHLESNLNGVNTHVSGVAAFEKENK
ncbi:MAG: hypothetical protein OEX07_08330, partial [Gammaproteobacteria bacterium]|nr:hypothetical protein [Gammaproteobacteria bacterium]